MRDYNYKTDIAAIIDVNMYNYFGEYVNILLYYPRNRVPEGYEVIDCFMTEIDTIRNFAYFLPMSVYIDEKGYFKYGAKDMEILSIEEVK